MMIELELQSTWSIAAVINSEPYGPLGYFKEATCEKHNWERGKLNEPRGGDRKRKYIIMQVLSS